MAPTSKTTLEQNLKSTYLPRWAGSRIRSHQHEKERRRMRKFNKFIFRLRTLSIVTFGFPCNVAFATLQLLPNVHADAPLTFDSVNILSTPLFEKDEMRWDEKTSGPVVKNINEPLILYSYCCPCTVLLWLRTSGSIYGDPDCTKYITTDNTWRDEGVDETETQLNLQPFGTWPTSYQNRRERTIFKSRAVVWSHNHLFSFWTKYQGQKQKKHKPRHTLPL